MLDGRCRSCRCYGRHARTGGERSGDRHLAGCGLDATIKVADMTRIAGRPADPSRAGVALMMQISNRSSIDTDLRSVMDSLSEEHDIAHRMFFTLIEPIRDTFGVGEDQ